MAAPAPDPTACGAWLGQAGAAVDWLVSSPVAYPSPPTRHCAFGPRSERLFLLLGQEAQLSAAAARYLAFVAPALPCMGITEACRRFLLAQVSPPAACWWWWANRPSCRRHLPVWFQALLWAGAGRAACFLSSDGSRVTERGRRRAPSRLAQGIVRPSTVVTAVLAALAPLYNWLFIVRLGLGLDGAAAALVAVQLTSLALMGSYVVYRNARWAVLPRCCRAQSRPANRYAGAGVMTGLLASLGQPTCMHADKRPSRRVVGAVPTAEGADCVPPCGPLSPRCRSLRGQPDSPWHGWSWAALRGWGQYLGLALPSVLMICCKWW